jgi:hypothetical protein
LLQNNPGNAGIIGNIATLTTAPDIGGLHTVSSVLHCELESPLSVRNYSRPLLRLSRTNHCAAKDVAWRGIFAADFPSLKFNSCLHYFHTPNAPTEESSLY